MSEHKWAGLPFSKTCQMLEAWGIDPSTVSIDDADEKGYYKFVFEIYDSKKRKLINRATGEAMKVFTPWPEGSSNTIYKMYVKEYNAVYDK